MRSSKLYLFKRGTRFYIQFKDQNDKQRQISTGCSTKASAMKYLRDHENEYTIEHHGKKLYQFVEEFSSYGKNIYARSTYRSYLASLKRFMGMAGDIRLSKISPLIVDRYKSNR
jgi:hypothetical protein